MKARKIKRKKKTGSRLGSLPVRKKRTPLFLLIGLGTALAIGGFVWYKRRTSQSDDAAADTSTEMPASNPAQSKVNSSGRKKANDSNIKWRDDRFPLSVGSSGKKVMDIQQKLIALFGSQILPAFGADGKFRAETANALKAKGLPVALDEYAYSKILATPLASTSPGAASTGNMMDNYKIASRILDTAKIQDATGVVNALRRIKNTSQYSKVNFYYRVLTHHSNDEARTVVTDLLSYKFKGDDDSASKFSKEFARIGLVYHQDQKLWQLSGADEQRLLKDIITLKDTYVKDIKGNIIPVSANTILGLEQHSENGLTFFKAIDQAIAAVPTRDIKYMY